MAKVFAIKFDWDNDPVYQQGREPPPTSRHKGCYEKESPKKSQGRNIKYGRRKAKGK